ncbi:MAG: hypothetical protein OD918_07100 [Gammaproteobacteria bacterium]
MTIHNILTILVLTGLGVFFYVAMRKVAEQDRRERKQQKNAAAK